MGIPGLHLTAIGSGDHLLEPSRSLDLAAADALIDAIGARLIAAGPGRLYYVLSELPVIDATYYNWLNRLARACRRMNVEVVCVGMQPTAACALACSDVDPPAFTSARSARA